MIEPQLILKLLVVPLDPPTDFGERDEFGEFHVFRNGGDPVFRRFRLAFGPLHEKPLDGARIASLFVSVCGTNALGRKAGNHHSLRTLAPVYRLPGLPWQQVGKLPGRDRGGVIPLSSHQPRRAPSARVALGRQRAFARRPNAGLGLDPHDVGKAPLGEGIPETGRVAVAGVGHHGGGRQVLLEKVVDLLQGNLPLLQEGDLGGDADPGPAFGVLRPLIRQIEPPGRRHAHRLVHQRNRHRHLAVRRLAQRAAVLPGHASRVAALLRNPGIVHHPGADGGMSFQLGQSVVPRHCQDRPLVPRSVGHEMMHALVGPAHAPGIDLGRHRLDALPLPRQK